MTVYGNNYEIVEFIAIMQHFDWQIYIVFL